MHAWARAKSSLLHPCCRWLCCFNSNRWVPSRNLNPQPPWVELLSSFYIHKKCTFQESSCEYTSETQTPRSVHSENHRCKNDSLYKPLSLPLLWLNRGYTCLLQPANSFTHTHTYTWPWWFDYSVTDVVGKAELMKKVFYWSVNQHFSPLGFYSRGQMKVWVDMGSLTPHNTASQPACVTFISAASVICPWIWQFHF